MSETTPVLMEIKNIETYSYNEVLMASTAYFEGDELAATTWISKYCMRDAKGNYLEKTPDAMHRRMSREFARIELKYSRKKKQGSSYDFLSEYGKHRDLLDEEKIFGLFSRFRYVIPQGSVMSSLGNPFIIASLSNCVVLPEVHDSYGGIFYTDQQLAQLFKRRCGVGIDLSTLRPDGTAVSNAAGTTTGPVSFMERFSNTTREVSQKGRRGALMMTMDIAHPDIESFITIKQDLSRITGANISVRLSDEFMAAVQNDTDYTHRWPIDSVNPKLTKTIRAKSLWNKIIKCAHHTAEPGLIFWDRQHKYSTSSIYPGFKNVSTNPCSEIAMQGGDSCRLIALNLYNFVDHPFTDNATFNFNRFYEAAYESQRLMDDLVDLELEAIERIIKKVKSDPEPEEIKMVELNTWKLLYDAGKKGRRTGLGFTALADTIAALNFSFDSADAIKITEKIMRTKCEAEFESSIDLSIERGSFEGFNGETEQQSEFIQMMRLEFPRVYERMMKFGRRNISISTVAPTGTLSILAQSSSGIEPVYMLSYKRRRKVNPNDANVRIDYVDHMGDSWMEFDVYHHKLLQWMDITGNKNQEQSPYFKSTAPDIDWKKRITLQAIVQKYTTHSISSTVNLPGNVSVELVGQIYLEAWHQGLKGITVYRDGSRSGVLLAGDKEQKKESPFPTPSQQEAERPQILEASVLRFMNGEEKWIAYIGILNQKPYEIFTGKAEDAFSIPAWVSSGWIIKNETASGKSRYDFRYVDKEGYKVTIEGLSRSFNQEYWNYAKLISGVLRHNMPLPQVVHLIENLNLYSDNINTWKAGVERALKKFIPDGTLAVDRKCTACGDPDGLIYEEGCLKCKSCANTKCG